MDKLDQTFVATNDKLQELGREAKENWLFDEDTDPDGKIAAGLDVLLSGDLEDAEVADAFQVANFPKGSDRWDALEDWVKRLA